MRHSTYVRATNNLLRRGGLTVMLYNGEDNEAKAEVDAQIYSVSERLDDDKSRA